MLVIAILVLCSVVATMVALIAASPLFRSIALAFDCWADQVQHSPQHQR